MVRCACWCVLCVGGRVTEGISTNRTYHSVRVQRPRMCNLEGSCHFSGRSLASFVILMRIKCVSRETTIMHQQPRVVHYAAVLEKSTGAQRSHPKRPRSRSHPSFRRLGMVAAMVVEVFNSPHLQGQSVSIHDCVFRARIAGPALYQPTR